MKNVSIRYNPYKLQTRIDVDGEEKRDNSKIAEYAEKGLRLQEWIEELPGLLYEEYNEVDFNVTFHGTFLDYEDLIASFDEAAKQIEKKDGNKLNVTFSHVPAKETSDKEKLIDKLFADLQKGPFEELRDKELIAAFEHARSSDFEVCVVATMSAGKSTLINSMLGTKLMPSKAEACTAIITRIKDSDAEDGRWTASVYDRDNRPIAQSSDLTIKEMERFNEDANVSTIEVLGDIPFVRADDVSLVLVDTPGPNNARNADHRKVQSEFLGKSSKSLVLYIMESTFGTDDDNNLLSRVAESMSVGGKQSKDRFLFVVNKWDLRNAEDDGQNETSLEGIRGYLKRHGIENPNLFPAAALPALNIRLADEKERQLEEARKSGSKDKANLEDFMEDVNDSVRKFNRRDYLHLENYASLPARLKNEIILQGVEAKSSGNDREAALVHTGIPAIEAAIRQYVQKYAKTAKVKNIADTFTHKLDELGCIEETKKRLAEDTEHYKQIVALIDGIQKKIDDGKEAQKFEEQVTSAVEKVQKDSENAVNAVREKFQRKINNRITETQRKGRISVEEAGSVVRSLGKFAEPLQPDLQSDLDEMVRKNLVTTGNALLERYRNKLASLATDIGEDVSIPIDPLQLMGASVVNADDFSIKKLVKTEVEEEWVANTGKKWYKPWTWAQPKGYWRDKEVSYVDAAELAREYFADIEQQIYDDADKAADFAKRQSERIAAAFNREFNRLDKELTAKLQELKSHAADREQAEKRVRESTRKLAWLEDVKKQIDSILEI